MNYLIPIHRSFKQFFILFLYNYYFLPYRFILIVDSLEFMSYTSKGKEEIFPCLLAVFPELVLNVF